MHFKQNKTKKTFRFAPGFVDNEGWLGEKHRHARTSPGSSVHTKDLTWNKMLAEANMALQSPPIPLISRNSI